jgi:hypothetical protein
MRKCLPLLVVHLNPQLQLLVLLCVLPPPTHYGILPFNLVKYVENKLKCVGNIDRIQSLSIEEARDLMLSYGLKAMLVGNLLRRIH